AQARGQQEHQEWGGEDECGTDGATTGARESQRTGHLLILPRERQGHRYHLILAGCQEGEDAMQGRRLGSPGISERASWSRLGRGLGCGRSAALRDRSASLSAV